MTYTKAAEKAALEALREAVDNLLGFHAPTFQSNDRGLYLSSQANEARKALHEAAQAWEESTRE